VRSNRSGLPADLVSDSAKNASSPRAATRITVSLVSKAAADLRRAIARTHLSQTDIVNRAVSLYEFIDSELAEGAEIIVRKEGQDQVVRLL
jgi:hypothetical protein